MPPLPLPPESLSSIEEEILKGICFTPFAQAYFNIEQLLEWYPATADQLRQSVARFEGEGLIKLFELHGGYRAYGATMNGWLSREAFLLERGLRHPALAHQRDHDLGDLIVALACAPVISNEKNTGMFGMEEAVAEEELRIYLHTYTEGELREAIERRLARGDLLPSTKMDRERVQQPALKVTKVGRHRYENEIAPNLAIAPSNSILELETRESLEVFWAWQSEYKKSRNLFKGALETVIERINREHKLVPQLRLIEAREPGEGAIRIDVEIQNKIRRAEFFVGDFTAVYQYEGRLRVNENVLVEVGYALASKEPSQVLLLALKRDDVPGPEADVVNRAFDIAHVHRLEFGAEEKPADVRSRVRTELEAALRRRKRLR